MRIRPLVVGLTVVVAACGEAGVASVPPPSAAPTSPAVTTDPTPAAAGTAGTTPTTGVTSQSENPTTRPAPNPDRAVAPDFVLTLSDGSEYQLANEVRPVYLVFWAEW